MDPLLADPVTAEVFQCFKLLPHLVVGQKHTVEHFIQDALPASLLQRLVRLAIQDAHLQGQMIELSIDCKQVQPKRLECS